MKLRIQFVRPDREGPAVISRVGTISVDWEQFTSEQILLIFVNPRRLLLWFAVLAPTLWFAAAGGLYGWLQRKPYNRVTFTDVAWPGRWRGIRDLRGQALIAEGMDDIKARRLAPGLFKLKIGLDLHPRDPAARFTVAEFFAKGNYYVGARDTLLPALEWPETSRSVFEPLIQWAWNADDPATVLTVCDKLLGGRPLTATDRSWLAQQRVSALLDMERIDDALAALAKLPSPEEMAARQLRVRALCAAGRAKEAVALIESWPPDSIVAALRLHMLATALRGAGRLDEMAAALEQLKALTPTMVEPRLVALDYYSRTGCKAAAWNELQGTLARFDADVSAMASIVRTCADAGALELVEVCLERARELGVRTEGIVDQLAVARACQGDLAGALRIARPIRESVKGGDARGRGAGPLSGAGTATARYGGPDPARAAVPLMVTGEWVEALLECASPESSGGAARLLAAMTRAQFALRAYYDTLEVLARAGRWAAVRAVAEGGLGIYPRSRRLEGWREKAAGHLAAEAPPPVAGRPVAEKHLTVATAAAVAPANDGKKIKDQTATEFFVRLDAARERRAWNEQHALIAVAREAKPAWFPEVESDLVWREVALAIEEDQLSRAVLLTGLRVRARKTEAVRALVIARDLAARGEKKGAQLLAEAMTEAAPEFRPGRAFLNELTNPPVVAPAK